jgi:hypothetical protein
MTPTERELTGYGASLRRRVHVANTSRLLNYWPRVVHDGNDDNTPHRVALESNNGELAQLLLKRGLERKGCVGNHGPGLLH